MEGEQFLEEEVVNSAANKFKLKLKFRCFLSIRTMYGKLTTTTYRKLTS